MDNPLFRRSNSPSSPTRIGVSLFENMPEATLDKTVFDALLKIKGRPFPSSDEHADALLQAMKKSSVLNGKQKRKILQTIIHNQLIFTNARRSMILQYLVDLTENEISPKALAFLFILEEIYFRSPEEQGPFVAGLGRCYRDMDSQSRDYIREQLLAQKVAPPLEERIITVGDETARLNALSRSNIEYILVQEKTDLRNIAFQFGQRLLALLHGKKK